MTLPDLSVLDDVRLHLLVLGPGTGESLMLRIPPGEWLVVDSFRRGDSGHVAAHALRRLRVRPRAVALTHPHEDHADGFVDLIDLQDDDGLVGCYEPFLRAEAWRESPDAARQLEQDAAESAIAGISRAWRRTEARWPLHVDAPDRAIGDATVRVLSPDDAAHQAVTGRARADLNELSAAMLVKWRGVALLLGADLTVPGWRRVAARPENADVAQAAGYKVAHHGSSNAHHAIALGAQAAPARGLVLTPFNAGRKVPSFADGKDVDLLLRYGSSLNLTTAGVVTPPLGPDRIATRAAIRDAATGISFGALTTTFEDSPADPGEAWILFSIAEDGSREVTTGAAAVVIES